MILLLLIPLAFALAISSAFDDEIQRVADQNGLGVFDPEEPSIFDDRETIFGTNTSETLIGTEGNDALFALGQADIVRGLSGDDLIDAGTNNDTVFGGAGDDIIGGGTGFDVIFGDAGDDVLLGNGGDDLLIGRVGNDLLIGGGGADSLNGGPGDDVLISGNLELDEIGEQDVSATALAVIRAQTAGVLEEVDFTTLEASCQLNGVDTSFLTEQPEPTQGGDLFGGDGNDLLVLSGGDTAQGGDGIDRFILNEDMADENTVLIADFTAGEDVIALEYNGTTAPEIDIRDRAENAVIFIGEDVIAIIEGGVGLVASDIRLVQTT